MRVNGIHIRKKSCGYVCGIRAIFGGDFIKSFSKFVRGRVIFWGSVWKSNSLIVLEIIQLLFKIGFRSGNWFHIVLSESWNIFGVSGTDIIEHFSESSHCFSQSLFTLLIHVRYQEEFIAPLHAPCAVIHSIFLSSAAFLHRQIDFVCLFLGFWDFRLCLLSSFHYWFVHLRAIVRVWWFKIYSFILRCTGNFWKDLWGLLLGRQWLKVSLRWIQRFKLANFNLGALIFDTHLGFGWIYYLHRHNSRYTPWLCRILILRWSTHSLYLLWLCFSLPHSFIFCKNRLVSSFDDISSSFSSCRVSVIWIKEFSSNILRRILIKRLHWFPLGIFVCHCCRSCLLWCCRSWRLCRSNCLRDFWWFS